MVSFLKRYHYHPIWNASTGRLVAPSPAASRPPLSHFFSLRLLYLPYEPPWLISLCDLMSGLFVSQSPFPLQVWPDMKWNQDSADPTGGLLRPLTLSCFLLLLLGSLSLLALHHLLGTWLSSLWSPPLSLHAPDLVLWRDDSVPFPLGKGGSGVLANCSLCGTEATLSFSAGPVCSSFSAEACTIVHALCWFWQHQQVCHFSSFLLYLTRTVLATLSSLSSFLLRQSLWQIWQELSSLFLSVLSGYNGFPDTRSSRGTTQLMSWPNRERYSPSLRSLVVSLLLYLISTFLGLEAYCFI